MRKARRPPGRARESRWLAAAVLTAASAVACSSEDSPRRTASGADDSSGTPYRGGTAKVGVLTEPATFLDWQAGTTVDLQVADLVFRKLARPTPEPGRFAPDLAESWRVLPDGRSVSFHLRPGARWEDGREVTVADVAFTEERARLPASSMILFKRGIETVESSGASDITFRFRWRDPELVALATRGHVYPRHLLGAVEPEAWPTHPFNAEPMGSGPFRLEHWKKQQYLSFVARADGAAGGRPYLDRIVIRIFADKDAAVRELEGGGLDLLCKVPRDSAERLAARGDFVVHRAPTRGFVFVAWNTKRAPWDRAEIRKALTAAIDRKALAKRFEGAESNVAHGPVPPDHPWHDPAFAATGHDPVSASAPLATLGKLTLLFLRGSAFQRDVAAVVADNLRKAGLDVETREMDRDAFRNRVEDRGDFDAALYSRPDLPVDLQGCFGTDGSENYGKLSDPKLDSLLDALGSETDLEKARETFVRAGRRVDELQPWTFLFYRSETIVASRRLHGFEGCLPNPMECAAEWWIPKDRQ